MSPLRDSIEIQGTRVVREEVGYCVEPHPKCEGRYELQGYDYVLKVHDNVFDRVRDFKGHKRAVWVLR